MAIESENKTVVNVHEAKTHFSKLIERVLAGERIVVARAGRPVIELKRVEEEPFTRPLGIDRGRVFIHDDWDDPLPEFEEYM
jgi:prevent-host-death family protein